jgi:hypothetical protein
MYLAHQSLDSEFDGLSEIEVRIKIKKAEEELFAKEKEQWMELRAMYLKDNPLSEQINIKKAEDSKKYFLEDVQSEEETIPQVPMIDFPMIHDSKWKKMGEVPDPPSCPEFKEVNSNSAIVTWTLVDDQNEKDDLFKGDPNEYNYRLFMKEEGIRDFNLVSIRISR